ncbi:MAG: hypothetical protein Q8N92_02500, partial [Erysipelotrichaceae bacterium]|nr:hypothetical protein [Erysipelotrichaceae bacterium]
MKKLFISCLVFMVLVLNFKLIDIKAKDFTTTTSGVISFTNAVLVTSTNNNLASLSVNNRSVPNFNAKTLSYDLGRTDSSSINIAAVTADGKATVSGTGTRNLAYGKNTLGVVVTAESG